MLGTLAPSPAHISHALASVDGAPERSATDLVNQIYANRRQFGITRLASLTRLGGTGIAVCQATRPLALSLAVSQGKGLEMGQAAISALMEALEGWAAESIPEARTRIQSARSLGSTIRTRFAGFRAHDLDLGWDQLHLRWIEGWDLISDTISLVPLALVDTVYTVPSPHPVVFPRTSTGLAAASSVRQALIHGGLEILEHHAIAAAERRVHFYERHEVSAETVAGPISHAILARMQAVGLHARIWRCPSPQDLPVFISHIFQRDEDDLAPLPADGSGCDFTPDRALARALLEACSARVTAISGAREDITRDHYPDRYDQRHLAAWKQRSMAVSPPTGESILAAPSSDRPALERVLGALRAAGAEAVIAVPLFSCGSPPIEVLRVVAPPLKGFFR